ncbi:hypothetical protein ACX3VG_22760, partial [Escherichia coli]
SSLVGSEMCIRDRVIYHVVRLTDNVTNGIFVNMR